MALATTSSMSSASGIHALGIAMSGYPYPSNVNEAGVTGFDYHLTKPVNCDDLLSLLEKSRANEAMPRQTSKIWQAGPVTLRNQ